MTEETDAPEGSEVLDCQWVDIRDLVHRTEVLLLSDELVLREVADALATDNVSAVKAWLDDGAIQKLSDFENPEETFEPGDNFQLIVITPFALIKRR